MVLRSPPLRRVSSFLEEEPPSPSLSSRLSEPLWHCTSNARLLVHCAQLHTLLELEASPHGEAAPLAQIYSSRPRVRQLVDAVCDDADHLNAYPSPMDLIERSGLACMCPLVGHFLGNPDKVYRDEQVPLVKHFLDQATGLNQLLVTARQLREDTRRSHFKYTAHKLALLYHAVNLSRTHREVLRKRIEERFEEVKAATEGEGAALGDHLAGWLIELCDEVCALVRAAPPPMRAQLGALALIQRGLRPEQEG
ncbi:hypothetical protein AB1Y20_010958 [Prymnesium parvum]|uniref:Uncharacterized protein n=1 Tax=Prymnesium parvum TaxID=97485 RepID=A0AB34IU83_PRYPA